MASAAAAGAASSYSCIRFCFHFISFGTPTQRRHNNKMYIINVYIIFYCFTCCSLAASFALCPAVCVFLFSCLCVEMWASFISRHFQQESLLKKYDCATCRFNWLCSKNKLPNLARQRSELQMQAHRYRYRRVAYQRQSTDQLSTAIAFSNSVCEHCKVWQSKSVSTLISKWMCALRAINCHRHSVVCNVNCTLLCCWRALHSLPISIDIDTDIELECALQAINCRRLAANFNVNCTL